MALPTACQGQIVTLALTRLSVHLLIECVIGAIGKCPGTNNPRRFF
jgi:hypothetical protein